MAYTEYRSKTVEFGQRMAGLRTRYPHGTWGKELERRGFNPSFVATAIKAAADPAWWATRQEKTRAASKAAKDAKRNFVVEDKVSSSPTSGEANEAFLGLKAAIHRAKHRPQDRDKWVATARGHLNLTKNSRACSRSNRAWFPPCTRSIPQRPASAGIPSNPTGAYWHPRFPCVSLPDRPGGRCRRLDT